MNGGAALELLARTSHWDTYYKGANVPEIPSQFAVFALAECRPDAVVDIGCGSGRDAFFFASRGIPTVGIDGSTAAVELYRSKAEGQPLNFIRLDINDASFSRKISPLISDSKNAMIYARFFIHAITEEEENNFLHHASHLVKKHGGTLALEFRTPRDRALSKATPDHYRRYVEPTSFVSKSKEFDFSLEYSVEGFGMAKYKDDDAYVSRVLLTQRENLRNA